DLEQSEALYLDNPFTGFMEGMYITFSLRRVPSDEPVAKFPWVVQLWLWAGQGNTTVKDGSCGSVVTDEEGRAVCFYRFVDEKGFAIGVAATVLGQFGYEISEQ